ncbi:MAG: hypothetical protein H7Z72_00130 [Bacteroidetes bacterium]|nr:hypothetical protein [Fibrella sp.]
MSFLNQLRQRFAEKNPSPTEPVVTAVAVVTGPDPVTAPVDRPEPIDAGQQGPVWLDDEDLLRDEGVFFGLSDARPDEMVALIRHEFTHQTAALEQTLDQYHEKIGELNLFIEQHENQISELRYKSDELALRKPVGHQLPRTLAGLSLSVLMCIGTFFLIDETLRPAFTQNRWISLGVFLAGMFSLFSRTSLFHETNTPTTPRRLLEETGLPLATALFVLAQALKTQPAGTALALFFFIFFLFLLAGKLLLGNLMVLGSDLHAVGQNRQLARERLSQTTGWESEITQLRANIDRFRVQKWQIIPELNRIQADLTRMNARRDGLIKRFESEFNLARSLRDRLTSEQRQAIISR